jgi:cathepsin E
MATLMSCDPSHRPPSYLPLLIYLMFQTAPLTGLILLAICVAANPVVVRNNLVSLPLARQLKFTGSKDLVNRDRARAKQLFSFSNAKHGDYLSADSDATVGLDATNAASSYRTTVGIGSPATSCESHQPSFIELIMDSIPPC